MGHWAYGNHVYFFFPRQITESTYKVPIDTLNIRIAVKPADIMPYWSWGSLIGWYFSKPRPSRSVKRRRATASLFWFCLRLRGSERAHWWRGELRRVTTIRHITGYIYARLPSMILQINCRRKGHNYMLVWYINLLFQINFSSTYFHPFSELYRCFQAWGTQKFTCDVACVM